MSRQHGPKIITSGLKLYLDAANKKSYPGTGTSWVDISRNGYQGTLISGVSHNPTGSMTFNGTDGYVSLGTVPDLSFTEEESLIIWCKPTNIDADRRSHVGARHSGFLTIYGSQFGYESVNDLGVWQNNLYSSTNAVALNTWQQLAFTFKTNGQIVLYKNGVKTAEKTSVGSQMPASAPYFIGTEAFGGWGTPMYFMGEISIVKNYNRELSANEILQNFNSIRYRYGL